MSKGISVQPSSIPSAPFLINVFAICNSFSFDACEMIPLLNSLNMT